MASAHLCSHVLDILLSTEGFAIVDEAIPENQTVKTLFDSYMDAILDNNQFNQA